MKRIWMSALLLLTALFATRAQAETVFLAGEGHAWFNAPEKQPRVIDYISDYINQTFSNRQ